MNEIELKKEIGKLYEINDSMAKLDYLIEIDLTKTIYFGKELEKLKFICLKYNLLEIDEIENLSNLDNNQLSNFFTDLRNKVTNEFIIAVKD